MTINKKNKELIEELNKGVKPNETEEERRLRLKELVKERIKKDQEFKKFIAEKNSYDAQIEERRKNYNERRGQNEWSRLNLYDDAWGDPLPPKKKGERFFDSVDPLYDDLWENDKGKEGKVLFVLPKKSKVVVEGINIMKRTIRPTQENPSGGFVEREAPIHVSNLMVVHNNKTVRVGWKIL